MNSAGSSSSECGYKSRECIDIEGSNDEKDNNIEGEMIEWKLMTEESDNQKAVEVSS